MFVNYLFFINIQLFKGKFYYCVGKNIQNILTKKECLLNAKNKWINKEQNFDNLGNALMSLFILISKDNWVDIMYSGIDAVGVDKQPIKNYNEWMIIYFITFLLFGGFFMFNTFVGVIIENFIKCRALQKIEENERNFAKRFRKFKRARKGNFYYYFIIKKFQNCKYF